MGSIELGVSQTCLADSGPQCIPVGDEYVLAPPELVSAAVTDARAGTDDDGQEVLDVAFDDGGGSVLQSTTEKVGQAGPHARLVMKVGDTVLSAVAVPAPLEGDQVRIALPTDLRARELIKLIEAA